ncbi:MAG: hypothetical protein NTW21_01795 [Verrucomicrobia bacterium]|nr:hypothetical protein [Verrucomicrobiota bacterium]
MKNPPMSRDLEACRHVAAASRGRPCWRRPAARNLTAIRRALRNLGSCNCAPMALRPEARSQCELAWEKVRSNAGAGGVDGITIGRFEQAE